MTTSYILNQLGEERGNYFNAVSPPIIQSSNFCFDTVEAFQKAVLDEENISIYTRGKNPTTDILAQKIAALEGAESCLVVGSGGTAVSMAVMNLLNAGDHVICIQKPYSWTFKLLTIQLEKYKIETTFVDGKYLESFEKAIRPNTKLIYLESPNSLFFDLQDVEAITKLAKKHGISTILDNSYASPLCQKPIEMGVDLVVHSATKYLNGHSDVVAGVICGSKKKISEIFKGEFMTLGGIISPQNAWLMIRSLRTLPIRIQKSSESAQKIVAFLDNHPKVDQVFYPFLKSNPQYELAKKQMKMPMGMFSFQLKTTDINQIKAFCESLEYFLMAVSWGGYESLILPTCVFPEEANMPNNIFRIYIGLEESEVLIQDLENSFSVISER